MARHAHEFYCTNCSWWNYPMLSDALSGNYEIKCGNCGHIHYRVIKDGVVIDDRAQSDIKHNQSRWSKGVDYWAGDTIHVMKSACSEKKRQNKLGMVARIREMASAGLMK